MVEHHIQKKILRQLVLGYDRFSELKPSGVDSNLFSYHLHQLVAGQYVKKTEDNRYHLTELGKAEGINLKLSEQERSAQAHSILLLSVRDTGGCHLLRKRTAHPMYGKIGYLHGEPKAHEHIEATAKKVLAERTGLTGEFETAGSGFIRIFIGNELESFTNFTLLRSTIDPAEIPIPRDETGENFWTGEIDPDFSRPEMLPSLADLARLCESSGGGHFFFDKAYNFAPHG